MVTFAMDLYVCKCFWIDNYYIKSDIEHLVADTNIGRRSVDLSNGCSEACYQDLLLLTLECAS